MGDGKKKNKYHRHRRWDHVREKTLMMRYIDDLDKENHGPNNYKNTRP